MKHLLAIPMSLLALTMATPAFADCNADIQPAKDKFIAVHDGLSEQDHMAIENAIGAALGFCSIGEEVDAQTKIAEAKSLLGIN